MFIISLVSSVHNKVDWNTKNCSKMNLWQFKKKTNVAGDPRHGGQQRRIWSARNHKELKGRLASECLQWKACEELADLKCYPEQTRAWAALCSRGYAVLTVGRGELAFLGLGELSGPR